MTSDVVSGLRENAFETSASLVVTNGANARLKHFTAGSAGLVSAVKETGPVKVVPVSVLVDNSLLGGDYGMVLSAGSDMSVTNVFVVRNGSRIVKGDLGPLWGQSPLALITVGRFEVVVPYLGGIWYNWFKLLGLMMSD